MFLLFNHFNQSVMRIGIDARFYGPSSGKGIGRYTQQLIANLEKIDYQNEYFIFLRKENFDLYLPQNKRFHKILANYKWYSFKEQVYFPFKLYKLKLDLVHFLHFNIPLLYFRKFIVTIHDLIHQKSSQESSTLPLFVFFLKKMAYFVVIKSAIKRSKKIITVSYFSKEEIVKYYSVKPNKIFVTYESN